MADMTFEAIKIGLASPEMMREWSYGEDKKPESAQGGDKRDELPAPKKDEPAGAAGEIDKENVRESEGAMTRAEARQLLDSMKDDEKFLPLRGFGTQKQRYESSYKDW